MIVPEPERLPSLNTIRIPEGVDDLRVSETLLNDFRLEIGGGLGKVCGKGMAGRSHGPLFFKENVILSFRTLFDS